MIYTLEACDTQNKDSLQLQSLTKKLSCRSPAPPHTLLMVVLLRYTHLRLQLLDIFLMSIKLSMYVSKLLLYSSFQE